MIQNHLEVLLEFKILFQLIFPFKLTYTYIYTILQKCVNVNIILHKFFLQLLLVIQGYSLEHILPYFSNIHTLYIYEFQSHCFTKMGLYFTNFLQFTFFSQRYSMEIWYIALKHFDKWLHNIPWRECLIISSIFYSSPNEKHLSFLSVFCH